MAKFTFGDKVHDTLGRTLVVVDNSPHQEGDNRQRYTVYLRDRGLVGIYEEDLRPGWIDTDSDAEWNDSVVNTW